MARATITDKQKARMERLIRKGGMSDAKIAEQVGVSHGSVYAMRKRMGLVNGKTAPGKTRRKASGALDHSDEWAKAKPTKKAPVRKSAKSEEAKPVRKKRTRKVDEKIEDKISAMISNIMQEAATEIMEGVTVLIEELEG